MVLRFFAHSFVIALLLCTHGIVARGQESAAQADSEVSETKSFSFSDRLTAEERSRLLSPDYVVTSVAELPHLEYHFPKREFKVDLVASVNNWDPAWRQLFVEGDGVANYVQIPPTLLTGTEKIRLGTQLRIRGEFVSDNYALYANSIEVLEDGEPGPVLQADKDNLLFASNWSRRIEMSGVVESVLLTGSVVQCVMKTEQRRFLARFLRPLSSKEALDLIGAELSYTATLAFLVDEEGRPVVPITHAMAEDKFELVREGKLLDDGDYRKISLDEQDDVPFGETVELAGQVSYMREYDFLLLQDEQETATLYAPFEADVSPGDMVRIIATKRDSKSENVTPPLYEGLDDLGISSDWFARVIFLNSNALPAREEMTAPEITASDVDKRNVTIGGKLIQSWSDGLERFVELEDGGVRFVGKFRASHDEFNELVLDQATRMKLTGLILKSDEQASGHPFSIEVADFREVEVTGRRLIVDRRYFLMFASACTVLVGLGGLLVWRLKGTVGKQNEDLARLVARLNTSYDAVREGILVIDNRGRVVATNSRVGEVLGVSPQDLMNVASAKNSGRHLKSRVQMLADCFQDKHAFLLAWQATQTNPKAVKSLELLTDDDPARSIVVFTAPVEAIDTGRKSDTPEARIWTFDDVSKRKQLEADLIQSQKMEAVGRLAGGVAHDFNNLLLAITANLEMARLKNVGEPKQREYLEAAEKAVDRASKLVKHLLGFSRKSNLEMRVRNPNQVVQRVESLLERILDAKVKLSIELDPNVRNTKMDDVHIEQVLLNLCLNARDACTKYGGNIRVKTSASTRAEVENTLCHGQTLAGTASEFVRIVVEDDGLGMSADVREKAFDPFFTTKELGKGTGLGLSMSLGIIEQHHGVMHFESEPNKGTRFEIFLPATDEIADLTDSRTGRLEKAEPAMGHLLLADDDELVRTATANALRSRGYDVTTVDNGVDALIHLRSTDYDLALLDLSMPGMSGTEVFAQIRAQNPELPIIVSSGYPDQLDEFSKKNDGALHAIISKPFRLAKLVSMIADSLANYAKSNSES